MRVYGPRPAAGPQLERPADPPGRVSGGEAAGQSCWHRHGQRRGGIGRHSTRGWVARDGAILPPSRRIVAMHPYGVIGRTRPRPQPRPLRLAQHTGASPALHNLAPLPTALAQLPALRPGHVRVPPYFGRGRRRRGGLQGRAGQRAWPGPFQCPHSGRGNRRGARALCAGGEVDDRGWRGGGNGVGAGVSVSEGRG